jgi:O-antigen ligase/tetratricopeptide (TPR) repeat protein
MEALLLALICLSPWALGGAGPLFELILSACVAVLLVLWAARLLLLGRLTWVHSGVALCLAGLFLEGLWQIAPLPPAVLARVAPSTAALYEQVLPARPEVPPGGERRDPAVRAGSTISLYPAATRARAFELLAAFLVFVVALDSVASVAALRRLSLAALLTGVLLSLFAVVHHFTAPPATLYWYLPIPGQPFGPFANRNHFAFFVNVCIGLGAGLLLARQAGRQRPREGAGGLGPLGSLLHDPASLWLSLALALMVGSVLFSASRGGALALLVGLSALFLLRRGRLGPLLLALAGGAGVLVWLGLGPLQARLAALDLDEQAPAESRLGLWAESLRLAREHPLWGTGYGTFSLAEPTMRATPQEVVFEHAENEYLEALVEGGLPALLLGVLAVALVYRLGWQALRRHRHDAVGALAVGALAAFTAVAVHSLVDFGLHMPAVALLATVLCANLCAVGLGHAPEERHSLRLGGLAPVAGAVVAVTLGLLLFGESWRAFQADRWRSRAAATEKDETRVAALAAAARLAPDSAYLRLELGRARLALAEEGKSAPKDGKPPAPVKHPEGRLARQKAAGLRDLLAARDLCPLLPEAQVRIAANASGYDRAEPSTAYRARAMRLAPADPELWFLCGAQALAEGKQEEAWEDWRGCLRLSGRHLELILDLSGQHLKPAELLARVLPPDRPAVLLRAADRLVPNPDAVEERRPFLEKALEAVADEPAPGAEDLHVKAAALRDLGRPEEAEKEYRSALARRPREAAWRWELAALLYQQKKLQESRRELLTILAVQPDEEARALLEAVDRELAEKGGRP